MFFCNISVKVKELLQFVDTIYRQRQNSCLKYNLTWNMLCWLFEKTEHVDGKQINVSTL